MKAEWDPPCGLVFFWFDITREKEALLLQSDLTRLFGNSDDRETDLAHPQIHEAVYVLAGSFAECRP